MSVELREYELQETENGYRYELERATLCMSQEAAELEVLDRMRLRGCGGEAATLHGPIPIIAWATVEVNEVPLKMEAGHAGASIAAIDEKPDEEEEKIEFPVNPDDPDDFPEPEE